MITTNSLIDSVKSTFGLPSDYAAAKKIGIKPSSISRYRNHGGTLDDSIAIEVAELLDLNPFDVIASMNFERATRQGNEKLKSMWRKYAA